MFLFRWPAPLWFLAGGGPVGSEATVCVSVTYKISCSVGELNSVDVNLSSLAFGLSASFTPPHPDDSFLSVQAAIDLDDNSYSSLDLKASITPVFVIDQSGQVQACVSSNYQVSASITASIGVDVVPSVSYKVSASLSASLLIADNVCVSANYQISASIGVALQVQLAQENKSISDQYRISASLTPVIAVVNTGGLVWSRTKQQYIAVRVGPFNES